jgi:hypothetical protein
MEDKALEIIRLMVGRRGLDMKTERVITDAIEKVNLYTVGGILVVFSQKDKGLLERDIKNFVEFASNNDYGTGLIIVALMPPSDNVLKTIKNMTKEQNIQFFHIHQLKFDITRSRRFSSDITSPSPRSSCRGLTHRMRWSSGLAVVPRM